MILDKLGIFGMDDIENVVMSAIMTGEPVLLIGEKGTAKTLLTKRLSQVLDRKYVSYNCSSANFDDIIGFPMPSEDKSEMNFISTPTSIWGKQFVNLDEINRARVDIQNNYFQVIRNRSVQGQKIDGLDYIFATMNPLSYEGTTPLDPALADRFSWTIRIPHFLSLSEADRKRIVGALSEDDSPLMDEECTGESTLSSAAEDINLLIDKAKELYPTIKTDHGKAVLSYVNSLVISLGRDSVMVDGRRAGMLYRNILSLAAIEKAKCAESFNISGVVAKAIKYSFPNEAFSDPIRQDVLNKSHENSEIFLHSSNADVLFKLQNAINPIEQFILANEMITKIDSSDFVKIALSSTDKLAGSIKTIPVSEAIMFFLYKSYKQNILECPVDIIYPFLKCVANVKDNHSAQALAVSQAYVENMINQVKEEVNDVPQ